MDLIKVNQQLNEFFTFVNGKLANFPNLSLGEQISYPSAGLGLILMLVALVLFIY